MPIYEYRCKACGAAFSHNMSMDEHDKLRSVLASPGLTALNVGNDVNVVRCPRCNDIRVEQQLCSFFSVTSKKT